MLPAILTYPAVTQVVSAAAQTEILTVIDTLLNVIPDPDVQSPSGATPSSPLWNDFSPRMAAQLRAELAAIKTTIDAAPTA